MEYIERGKGDKDFRFSLCFSLWFIGVGLLFIAIIIGAAISDNQIMIGKKTAKAHVTEVREYTLEMGDVFHNVYVDYKVDGVEYTHVKMPYYKKNMEEGKDIKIYYESDNPGLPIKKESINFWLVFGLGMACIAIGVGCPHLIKAIKIKGLSKLKRTGRCIKVPIVELSSNFVVCIGEDPVTGQNERFEWKFSEATLYNRMDFDDLLRVYIDEKDPKKYYVDIKAVTKVKEVQKTEPEIETTESFTEKLKWD